jgi:oxaloacetate decarboxylase alpha subunit
VQTSHNAGLQAIVNLIYTITPRHTDEYYGQKAREAAGLKVHRICLKDPGGLLTPERTRTLVPAILCHCGGIPVELHTHCNTGLGPLCCLEAIKLGITSLNTAIPPLANGSSNPSVLNVMKNARALGRPTVGKSVLNRSNSISLPSQSEGLPVGVPLPRPLPPYPRMISIFGTSLRRSDWKQVERCSKQPGAGGIGFLHGDAYSQFVGVQAAMNVIQGALCGYLTKSFIMPRGCGARRKLFDGPQHQGPDVERRAGVVWHPPEPC